MAAAGAGAGEGGRRAAGGTGERLGAGGGRAALPEPAWWAAPPPALPWASSYPHTSHEHSHLTNIGLRSLNCSLEASCREKKLALPINGHSAEVTFAFSKHRGGRWLRPRAALRVVRGPRGPRRTPFPSFRLILSNSSPIPSQMTAVASALAEPKRKRRVRLRHAAREHFLAATFLRGFKGKRTCKNFHFLSLRNE